MTFLYNDLEWACIGEVEALRGSFKCLQIVLGDIDPVFDIEVRFLSLFIGLFFLILLYHGQFNLGL